MTTHFYLKGYATLFMPNSNNKDKLKKYVDIFPNSKYLIKIGNTQLLKLCKPALFYPIK